MELKTLTEIANETPEERAERRSFEADFTTEIPGAGDIQRRIREALREVPLNEPSLAERDASAELRAELMEYAFGWFSERKATLDETALISRSCAMLAHRLTVANERADVPAHTLVDEGTHQLFRDLIAPLFGDPMKALPAERQTQIEAVLTDVAQLKAQAELDRKRWAALGRWFEERQAGR
jgi:hypothetical protein